MPLRLRQNMDLRELGGVEYSKFLYDCACSNLRKKKISIEYLVNADAKDYEMYEKFDIFFLNNPFDETILEPVAKKIFETHRGKECRLYFLNPYLKARTDAIEKAGFKLMKQIPDKWEWYFNINVYINGD